MGRVAARSVSELGYAEKQWLPGLDTFTFVGDAWSVPQIDNVRIYATEANTR